MGDIRKLRLWHPPPFHQEWLKVHLHMTDSPLEDGTAENLQGVLDQKRGTFCCTVDQVSQTCCESPRRMAPVFVSLFRLGQVH